METSNILFLALFFLLITALACLKGPQISDRRVQLFRVLFPSWRFFDVMGETPTLYYRVASSSEDLGEWQAALEKPELRSPYWPFNLFLNSENNFVLAGYSLVEQLVSDMEEMYGEIQGETQGVTGRDSEELERSVSFQLVDNLVRFQIRQNLQPTPTEAKLVYQFKVRSEPIRKVNQTAARNQEAVSIAGAPVDILVSKSYTHNFYFGEPERAAARRV